MTRHRGTATAPGTDGVDLARAEGVALHLASWAAEEMVRAARSGPLEVETKDHPADLVTPVDRRIEAHVRWVLAEQFPGHGVRGEESGGPAGTGARPLWLVDPVDGTVNFAHGLGWSSFALALLDVDGTPLVGVVADPWRGETFSAVRGGGARCNGAPVHAGDTRSLAGQLVLTELSAHLPWPGMAELVLALAALHCTTRIMGSSALSLAQVAAGRAAGAVLGSDEPLDTAAGRLIAVEAGARVTVVRPGAGREGTASVLVASAPRVAALVRRAAGVPDRG